jgi:hypothetical protein
MVEKPERTLDDAGLGKTWPSADRGDPFPRMRERRQASG